MHPHYRVTDSSQKLRNSKPSNVTALIPNYKESTTSFIKSRQSTPIACKETSGEEFSHILLLYLMDYILFRAREKKKK